MDITAEELKDMTVKEINDFKIEDIAKKKIKNLKEISKPIIEFLKQNYNPHTTVIISTDSIKVVSDEISIPIIYD